MTDDRYALKTPETHPDHHTVGKYFCSGWDGVIYYCDSYDPSIGYWMTPIDVTDKDWRPVERKNVSERAIGRSFHEIWMYDDGHCNSTLGRWTGKERFLYYVSIGKITPRAVR